MISHDILGEWWEKTVIHHGIPWYTMIYHWTLDDFRNPSFETPFHSSPQRYPANSLGKPWQGQQHGLGFAWEKAHEIGFLHYHAISCPKKLQLALFWYQPQLQPDCDPLSLSHFLATRSTPLRSTSWRFTGAGPPGRSSHVEPPIHQARGFWGQPLCFRAHFSVVHKHRTHRTP